ncbi:MAG: DUF4249 family protein [Saprospiraceae bacterium]|nr:DUF4249 family protein [Saprospiraceae bacterium]
MKKLLLLLPFGLFLSACANDFDVTAPWKEIPVVYGILSPQDSAHYIRVEKAFVDPEKSALEIAQIADSLYYPENAITVWLENTDNQSRIQLQRVDGALEGYPREEGIFAGQPNWLYKVNPSSPFVLPGKSYRLVIERADGKEDITATTAIPSEFIITSPNPTDTPVRIDFIEDKNTSVGWRTDVNGVFFNVTFVVRILEKALNGTTLETKTLVWEAAKNVERDETASGGVYRATVLLPGVSFFRFLAENLQKPAPDRYREFQSCDILIEGGGREIKQYLETAQANSGLTGAEVFPNFTNISEGYGIFTGKSRTTFTGVRFRQETVASMNQSSITDTLGFIF